MISPLYGKIIERKNKGEERKNSFYLNFLWYISGELEKTYNRKDDMKMETIIFEGEKNNAEEKFKKLLEGKNTPYTIINIDEEGICEELLLEVLKNSVIGLAEILRKPQKDEERAVYDRLLDKKNDQPLSEIVRFLSEHPQHIRRPIMIQERFDPRNHSQYYVSEIGSTAVEGYLLKQK